MRMPRPLLLAIASFSTLTSSGNVQSGHGHTIHDVENVDITRLDQTERGSILTPRCDRWVGIEVIYMVEVTEVCPEGSTATETLTEVSTLARSICATPTPDRPCYPCVAGTAPSSDDTVTVIMTSCSTDTNESITFTIQYCSTCARTTYVATVTGYTPGGTCKGCSPYSTAFSSSSGNLPVTGTAPCSESEITTTTTTSTVTTLTTTLSTTTNASAGLSVSSLGALSTTTSSSPSTSSSSTSSTACSESEVSPISTSTTTSTTTTTTTSSSSSSSSTFSSLTTTTETATATATNTPYKPTTTLAPPAATGAAGTLQNRAGGGGAGCWVAGLVMWVVVVSV